MRQRSITRAQVENGRLHAAFQEHALSLLRFCTLLTGRDQAAEDLVQESFVRFAQVVDRLDEDAEWPYLRRIAVNVWRNRRRRSAVEARARLVRNRDPIAEATAVEEQEWVWQAVRALPPRQRACVVLRYYEDLSERSTAAVLGCSVGAVKSQTSRALAKLREELDHED